MRRYETGFALLMTRRSQVQILPQLRRSSRPEALSHGETASCLCDP
jgi:hypothetical protein